MGACDEYASIYWAAACLSLWAGRGVTDVQFATAVGATSDIARLTATQEAVLDELVNDMQKGERNGTH